MALSLILRNSKRFQYSPMKTLLGATYGVNYFSNLNINRNLLLNENTPVIISKPLLSQIKSLPTLETKRYAHGNHSVLWTIEKILSLSLLPLLPATVLFPNPILDNITCALLVMHVHWGLESCVIDYCRPIVIGNFLSKLCNIAVYIVSILTLGGLIYFNQNDVGFGNFINCLWHVKSDELQEGKKDK